MFTGQTAYCNAGARATQTVTVAYPGVRLKCPKSAKPAGCKFKLVSGEEEEAQGEGRERDREGEGEGRALEDRLAEAQEGLRQQARAAKKILVKETVTIAGSTKTSFRKLKIVR